MAPGGRKNVGRNVPSGEGGHVPPDLPVTCPLASAGADVPEDVGRVRRCRLGGDEASGPSGGPGHRPPHGPSAMGSEGTCGWCLRVTVRCPVGGPASPRAGALSPHVLLAGHAAWTLGGTRAGTTGRTWGHLGLQRGRAGEASRTRGVAMAPPHVPRGCRPAWAQLDASASPLGPRRPPRLPAVSLGTSPAWLPGPFPGRRRGAPSPVASGRGIDSLVTGRHRGRAQGPRPQHRGHLPALRPPPRGSTWGASGPTSPLRTAAPGAAETPAEPSRPGVRRTVQGCRRHVRSSRCDSAVLSSSL